MVIDTILPYTAVISEEISGANVGIHAAAGVLERALENIDVTTIQ